MDRMRTHKTVSSLVAGLVCLVMPEAPHAANFTKLPGTIAGIVRNQFGMPLPGAAVQLFNHQERLLTRVLTDDHGQFRFADLAPDLYAVRVTRLSYDVARRPNIEVRPGAHTMLTVSLATLFSSIQISYPTIESVPMTDEWKWVLRSDSQTRPVFRMLPDSPADTAATGSTAQATTDGQAPQRAAMFSDTRGMVRVSAGDGNLSAVGTSTQADLGTTFALATALYGSGLLQVSGNFGYGSQSGAPAGAIRTSYSRSLLGTSPEVSLTMRQLNMPGRVVAAMTGQTDVAIPTLRTMSASVDDKIQLSDQLFLQYGSTMDYVSFLDHLNYLSPYARLSYRVSRDGELDFAYTSGNARPNLAGASGPDADLQRDLDTLGMFPRVSLLGGQTKIQRGEEFEAGYRQRVGSRTYNVSAYHESVINAALSMVAPAGMFASADVMPDLFSANSIFNVGNYQSSGFAAAVTQDVGDNVSISMMLDSTGGLTTADRELVSDNPDQLREMIRMGRRNAATVRIAAVVPRVGTRFSSSYQWSGDQRWAMAGNLYSTQSLRPLPGLNIVIRQPIPGARHIEATAELQNLLAQGYLPLYTPDGQRILLVQTPRSIRGGFSFIF